MKSEEKMMEPQIIAPSLMGSYRLTISFITSFVAFACILQTINLSMAIVCLNQRSKLLNVTEDCNCTVNSEFNASNGTFEETSKERGMYLDKKAQGMLLGALYYGVVPVQILVGWLCDKYGINKLHIYVGSGLLALSSLLTPVVLEFGGVPYYFALRVIKGITMSFALSSLIPLLTSWTTKAEQGLLMGISSAGMGVANTVTYPISGMLCRYTGWKSIFYFGGICGLVSTLLVMYFVYDTPAKHPRVGVEEKQYILAHQIQSQSSKKSKVIPWSKIFLSIPVWAVVLTHFFFFAVAKGTVLNLPIFVRDVLDFTVTENGVFSAMPLVGALVVHIVAGPMFDYVRIRYPSSVTTIRKIFQSIGTVAPAALMFVCSQLTPEHKYYVISLITIGYSLNEFAFMGGYWYTMVDIAPDFVGILQGLTKTIGLAPGFIIPPIIATLTPNETSEEWSHVFLLIGGLYLASCLTYVIFGSAKLQSWGKVEKNSINEEKII